MTSFESLHVRHAVLAICPDLPADKPVWADVDDACPDADHDLWRAFTGCLLSSQVPFALAEAAADEIMSARAIERAAAAGSDEPLREILAHPITVEGRPRRYRFYNVKATQLARSWSIVHRAAGGLGPLLRTFPDDRSARRWLVRLAPGLGPKQASMFLRDIGYSQDLAVLDRHILDYMALMGLAPAGLRHVSSLPRYRELEDRLREHARGLGYSLGRLDKAIWIVMRVARRENVRSLCE